MLHLLAAFHSTPWALDEAVLRSMTAVLHRWAAGVKLSAAEIRAAVGDAPEAAAQRRLAAQQSSGGGVYVVPVYGVLTHRAHAAGNTSQPLTSTEALSVAVKAAAADPNVGAIVLDIDSPGGSVFGVEELGQTIAAAAKVKPVVAVANSTAASGAYWIASQASRIVVAPGGMVGSIGVVLPHDDLSAAYEQAGIKREFITYGQHKAEGNDTGPLSPETRANLQAMVDAYGAEFTSAVAKGRRAAGVSVSVEDVRGPAFGQGRMKLAADAIASGMADAVDTLDNVIAQYRKPARGMKTAAALRDIQILET